MMEVTAKAKGHRKVNTRQNRLAVIRLAVLAGKSPSEIGEVMGMSRYQIYALMSASFVPFDYLPMKSVAEVMGLTDG